MTVGDANGVGGVDGGVVTVVVVPSVHLMLTKLGAASPATSMYIAVAKTHAAATNAAPAIRHPHALVTPATNVTALSLVAYIR